MQAFGRHGKRKVADVLQYGFEFLWGNGRYKGSWFSRDSRAIWNGQDECTSSQTTEWFLDHQKYALKREIGTIGIGQAKFYDVKRVLDFHLCKEQEE